MIGTKAKSKIALSKRTAAVRRLAISMGLSRVEEINKQKTRGLSWAQDADLSQQYTSIDSIDLELYKMDLDHVEGDLSDAD